MNYREKIRKAIECPQFNNTRYGVWGALTFEQRKYIKKLLDELDSADNYFKKVYLENQELKKQLHEASLTIQEMTEQDIECPSNCEKLRKLKKQLEDKTEDYKRMKDNFDSKVDVITEIDTQQKEFINYLEEEIKIYSKTTYAEEILKELEEILKEYKKIIGDDK